MVKKIKIVIDGKEFEAEARTFASGRKGYGVYDGTVKIDNCLHRISMNLIEF